jgi:hypothetical protein
MDCPLSILGEAGVIEPAASAALTETVADAGEVWIEGAVALSVTLNSKA